MRQTNQAVVIARVSSKSQEDEGYSLDSQVNLLHTYCRSKELVVMKTYKITESASKSSQRQTFKSAMAFIAEHDIKNLIIEKVDRHVRNLQDAVETHDWLTADENKRVHFVKDSLVLHKNSRSQEWLNWGIRVVMAKNYIDNLREEAMKGWAEKLAQGWLPASPPPGYKTVTENGKKIHIPDPVDSKLMIKMFRFYALPGNSLDDTRDYMAKLGLTTSKDNPYSKSHLHRILMNPFYIGINRFNGKEYPGAQETFISKSLFKSVQQKLHRGRPQKYKKHSSPLQGLIRCQDCGSVVSWQRQKGYYYGVCRRLSPACKQAPMLREDKVEQLIVNKLQELVCPSQEIIDWITEQIRARYSEHLQERERRIEIAEMQIRRIERMSEMLYDDKLAGELSEEKYRQKHTELVDKKAELAASLTDSNAGVSLGLEHRTVVLELSQKAAEIYQKKLPEQKQLIISKLFDTLILKGGALSVKHSKFAAAIAQNVQKTTKLLEN